jgi:hypothetical protein
VGKPKIDQRALKAAATRLGRVRLETIYNTMGASGRAARTVAGALDSGLPACPEGAGNGAGSQAGLEFLIQNALRLYAEELAKVYEAVLAGAEATRG